MRKAEENEWFTLEGQILSSIEMKDNQELYLKSVSGRSWILAHGQECCETVDFVGVDGNSKNLIGKKIVKAYTDNGAEPPSWYRNWSSSGWTLWETFTLESEDGTKVTWRSIGDSNGYYGVQMTFSEIKHI